MREIRAEFACIRGCAFHSSAGCQGSVTAVSRPLREMGASRRFAPCPEQGVLAHRQGDDLVGGVTENRHLLRTRAGRADVCRLASLAANRRGNKWPLDRNNEG